MHFQPSFISIEVAVAAASIATADSPLSLAYLHLLGDTRCLGEADQVAYTGFLAFSASLASSVYLCVGRAGPERFVLWLRTGPPPLGALSHLQRSQRLGDVNSTLRRCLGARPPPSLSLSGTSKGLENEAHESTSLPTCALANMPGGIETGH